MRPFVKLMRKLKIHSIFWNITVKYETIHTDEWDVPCTANLPPFNHHKITDFKELSNFYLYNFFFMANICVSSRLILLQCRWSKHVDSIYNSNYTEMHFKWYTKFDWELVSKWKRKREKERIEKGQYPCLIHMFYVQLIVIVYNNVFRNCIKHEHRFLHWFTGAVPHIHEILYW